MASVNSGSMRESKGQRDTGFRFTRRSFLKVSAFTGVALFASRLVKFPRQSFSPPQEATGVLSEKLIATSCLNCGTRCGTQVRVANGKAVRITGNPLSQVSEGEICPRGHIGLQVLYDPDRVTGPMKRSNSSKGRGVDPKWVPITWSEALNEVGARLKSVREKGPHQLLVLSGLNTTSDQDIINRFAEAYGTPNIVSEETLENEAVKLGRWMADGHFTQVAYDIGQTNYILAFGAGILEAEKPLARNLRMWGKIRRERPTRASVVVIDPRYSVTAARADRWVPIRPGTDGALAMAIANVIISEELYDKEFVEKWSAGFEEYKKAALEYSPEKVASITGVDAETIRRIARDFGQTKPAIAWAGRGVAAWPDGAYSSYAVFCLNGLVGSIDVPGGIIYQVDPLYKDMPEVVEDDLARQGKSKQRVDLGSTNPFYTARSAANRVADAIEDGSPYPLQMAIGFNANFNMSAPGVQRWDEALKKLPYYVHVAPFMSEMASYADIILPSPTFLDGWGYDHSPPGSGFAELKIKQPVVEPVHDTMGIIDITFDLARKLGGTVAQSFTGLGDDAQGFVKYRTESITSWNDLRQEGVWVGPAYQYRKLDRVFNTPSKKFEFNSGNMDSTLKKNGVNVTPLALLPHQGEVKFLGDEKDYPFVLSTYRPLLNIESGNQNYPWAQEIYLVMHGVGWTNFAEINTETAKELGIRDKDELWVESPFGKLKVKARVTAGIHPEVIAIANGQGHYAGGQWQKGMGVNPNEIIGVDYDPLSGQSAFFNTRVRVRKA